MMSIILEKDNHLWPRWSDLVLHQMSKPIEKSKNRTIYEVGPHGILYLLKG